MNVIIIVSAAVVLGFAARRIKSSARLNRRRRAWKDTEYR
jgi:hypothetical protein